MTDEEKIAKHRTFLRNRQKASDEDMAYPMTRSAKDITKGKEPKEESQRRGIWDEPIKLYLRDRIKSRRSE